MHTCVTALESIHSVYSHVQPTPISRIHFMILQIQFKT